MRRPPWPLGLLALAFTAPGAGSARADVFEPIQLASASTVAPKQQADFARDPAISGDGRYVAFDGAFGGEGGVWRRDLATGSVERVAGAPAELPSISENGRYISFTTTEKLVPEDTNGAPDVYVRDMEPGAGEPEYTLASAITVEGRTQDLAYEYAAAPGTPARTREEARVGALASGRSALSADGHKVVFVTTASSALAGPGTPALQVAVRDVQTGETQLVSALANPATGSPELNADGQDVPVPTAEISGSLYGAVYPGGAQSPQFSPLGDEASFGQSAVGASISADGSTVAWMAQQVGEQTQTLAGEGAVIGAAYTEPLWRRIADGPESPTRRVTGGSDPASSACASSGETQLAFPPTLEDPCQGPFEVGAGVERDGIWTRGPEGADYLPRLSGNGQTVAFISNAHDLAAGNEFGSVLESSDDLFVTNMQSGLTRVLALSRVTEIASGNSQDTARTAAIVDLGISPDGKQVAFSTKRTVFPLSSPAYVSVPAAAPGMSELFDVDLANATLTRLTHGFGGEGVPAEQPHPEVPNGQDPYEEPQEGSFSPSFSADGNVLAFSSSADNLIYGDGNGADDVFVIDRKVFAPTATEAYVSSPPPEPPLAPEWRIGVSARSRGDGSVVVYAQLPGSGLLRASAAGNVRVGAASRHSRNRHVRTALARVASAARSVAGGAGLSSITLKLASRYRALDTEKGGFSAIASVIFKAPGHPTLRESIPVTFVHTVKPRHAKKGRR